MKLFSKIVCLCVWKYIHFKFIRLKSCGNLTRTAFCINSFLKYYLISCLNCTHPESWLALCRYPKLVFFDQAVNNIHDQFSSFIGSFKRSLPGSTSTPINCDCSLLIKWGVKCRVTLHWFQSRETTSWAGHILWQLYLLRTQWQRLSQAYSTTWQKRILQPVWTGLGPTYPSV